MNKKRVAVLVAIYRAGPFLKAKLKTLEDQTDFDKCQIVLLNCQNLDNERAIYSKFVADNDNVSVIEYTEHKRLYTTWNDGIRATDTDYIMNSNADDILHPYCISSLIDALDTNPGYGIAHTDFCVTAYTNRPWPDWIRHGIIETIYPLGTAGPCPMWRRSLHQQFGLFPEYRVIGDARMWEKWHANGVKFLRVPTELVSYYQAPNHNLETRVDPVIGKPMRQLDIEDGELEYLPY